MTIDNDCNGNIDSNSLCEISCIIAVYAEGKGLPICFAATIALGL